MKNNKITIFCLLASLLSIFATNCKPPSANVDSQIAGVTETSNTFYACQTATMVENKKIVYEVLKINNTLSNISIKIANTSDSPQNLSKIGNQYWESADYGVRFGMKKNGLKSIQVYYKPNKVTASFENGSCELFCENSTIRAGDRCIATGSAPDDPYGNLAIDIVSGGFTGAIRGTIGRLMATKGISFATAKCFAKTIPLQTNYVGENLAGNAKGWLVKYLTPAERMAYRLTLEGGKFFQNGKLFDTALAKTAHTGAGRAIFVVDDAGNIYASMSHKPGKFHHSSFLAGGNVLTAGELVVEKGVLKLISNKSGHYRPPADSIKTLLGVLNEAGLNIAQITTDFVVAP
jgi:hypothetical protein